MNGRFQGTFKDDLLVFCKGDKDSVHVIKEALEELSKTSSLAINYEKSQIFMGGVTHPESLSQKINLSIGSFPFSKCRQECFRGGDFQVGPTISAAGVRGLGVCRTIS
uniref:Reverse transcriptase domain-containing protein n=1 Tax=Cannabis sativa TaxID=3483 RepID=A0A803Q7D6_CANSA